MQVGNADMLNCYYAHGDEAEDVRLQVCQPATHPAREIALVVQILRFSPGRRSWPVPAESVTAIT